MKIMVKTAICLVMSMMLAVANAEAKKTVRENWPNGESMDSWFEDMAKVDVDKLGKKYLITDYGVRQQTDEIQTKAIQAVIDKAADNGGLIGHLIGERHGEEGERWKPPSRDRTELRKSTIGKTRKFIQPL